MGIKRSSPKAFNTRSGSPFSPGRMAPRGMRFTAPSLAQLRSAVPVSPGRSSRANASASVIVARPRRDRASAVRVWSIQVSETENGSRPGRVIFTSLPGDSFPGAPAVKNTSSQRPLAPVRLSSGVPAFRKAPALAETVVTSPASGALSTRGF